MSLRAAHGPLAVLAVLVASVAGAAPASAEAWARQDALSDVGRVVDDPAMGTRTIEPTPEARHADITDVTIDLDGIGLDVLLDVDDLEPRRDKDVQVRVVTVAGEFLVTGSRRAGTGRARVQALHTEDRIACRHAFLRVRSEQDVIVVSVPSSCLGTPRAARVGVGLRSSQGSDHGVDDALRDAPTLRPLKLTPWLSINRS